MVQDRARRRADMAGAGPDQLFFAAVTIEHADRVHSVVSRPDHVVAAVTDHQRLRRFHAGVFKRVGQEVAFVDAGAVQFGAKHLLEIAAEAEMLDDALGKDSGLAGGNEQPAVAIASAR